MKSFNIDDFYIESDSKKEAELVKNECSTNNDLIIIKKGDKIHIIDLGESDTVKVWYKHKQSIKYCGSIKNGVGKKIIQSAVDSIHSTSVESGRLKLITKENNKKRKEKIDRQVVEKYESSLPPTVVGDYERIMKEIEANLSYRIDMYQQISDYGIKSIDSENWLPIIHWYKNHIISKLNEKSINERPTNYALRTSFVSTVKKMVSSGAKNASILTLASNEKRDGKFWTDYADNK